MREIYEIGEIPDLGDVPGSMYAHVIREDRFGAPRDAFRVERVPVPELGPDDVLVYVMAAGLNYNNVWAALGKPVNVIASRRRQGATESFHIGGSDASGVVWAVGKEVRNVKVGDEVVLHCGQWDGDDPHVLAGGDPMLAPSQRIWGYESNWGSFAQFCKVQAHQCVPKPEALTWEEAAAFMLAGATAYRMLHGWAPNAVQEGDPVLIWGGAGGVGCFAVQIARACGARPVAVVSSEEKAAYCRSIGAVGVIDRRQFRHWGRLPAFDSEESEEYTREMRAFGRAFWDALGERRGAKLVIEHPGESTLPTSMYVCETGGMVVICAGTTGFYASLDLRYHWMRQKRLQGSHFANDREAQAIARLVGQGAVSPCLESTRPFTDIGACHQDLLEQRNACGKMAVLVNAPVPNLRNLSETRRRGERRRSDVSFRPNHAVASGRIAMAKP